jgi:hypothetical protein
MRHTRQLTVAIADRTRWAQKNELSGGKADGVVLLRNTIIVISSELLLSTVRL